MKQCNFAGEKNLRRIGAHERLTRQLESGVKPDKSSSSKTIPLTDEDKARIVREINSLEKKVIPYELSIRVKPKKYRGVK